MSASCSASSETAAAAALLGAVRQAGGGPFDLAVVLGSGWGGALVGARRLAHFAYQDWPCFPPGQIAGHAGRLEVLDWQGSKVLAFVGRWHCYQGVTAYAAAYPARLAAALSIPRLALTCAAGGIDPAFAPGDFMLVSDHLNFLGDNPLRGCSPAFIDLCGLYRQEEFSSLAAAARRHGSTLHRGVLAAMPGPSYETPAEIAMLERLGAAAVAMSTVPEAIMARSLGQEVAALALIANRAAGRSPGAIDHHEVLACGERVAAAAADLLATLVEEWRRTPGEKPIKKGNPSKTKNK